MKKLFILLFAAATIISMALITGCNSLDSADNSNKINIKDIAIALVPLGETAGQAYLESLVSDGKITTDQKSQIIDIYSKIKSSQNQKGLQTGSTGVTVKPKVNNDDKLLITNNLDKASDTECINTTNSLNKPKETDAETKIKD